MAKGNDDGFDNMFDMWQQGQEAFLKAQKEAVDGFNNSLSGAFGKTGGIDMPIMGSDEAAKAWSGFINSWAPTWDPTSMMANMPGADIFTKGNTTLFGMLDPANWTHQAPDQLRRILQTVAQGPQFADLATPQVDAAEAWREGLDYQQAAADFTRVLHGAWTRAFEKYSAEFSLEDLQSGDVKEALDAWLKAANAELLDTQSTPEFMDAQKRLLRAGIEIKARQREMAEAWSEAYQMPTRTEVDDMAKIIHELRREVRKLKREIGSLKATQ